MFKFTKSMVVAGALVFSGAVQAADFTLSSSEIGEGKALSNAQVFGGFGCKGDNVSPSLSWSGAPMGTKSFVVTAYDPDAPTGSGWWHWVVFNIPATVTALPLNAGSGKGMPAGAVQSRTDFGMTGYGGACPPPGQVHRYVFTVYALGAEKLDLNKDASAALVGFMTTANGLAKASITAVYTR